MTQSSQIQNPDERDPRTYAIIGTAMEVHRELGCGFLEPVYQEALEMELGLRGIPFRSQVELPIHYKGRVLTKKYCNRSPAYVAGSNDGAGVAPR
jgi:hypothetical protein